jgi:hypothetical protein
MQASSVSLVFAARGAGLAGGAPVAEHAPDPACGAAPPPVPAAFAGTVTLAAHQRAADYTIAKARLGVLAMAWGAAVLLGWTLLGGLDLLNTTLRDACSRAGATWPTSWRC